jgi:hypothetical protein
VEKLGRVPEKELLLHWKVDRAVQVEKLGRVPEKELL